MHMPTRSSGFHAAIPAVRNIMLRLMTFESKIIRRVIRVFDLSSNSNGSVHDVYFNNFQLLGGNPAPSTISGNDPSQMVSDITFNNLNVWEI